MPSPRGPEPCLENLGGAGAEPPVRTSWIVRTIPSVFETALSSGPGLHLAHWVDRCQRRLGSKKKGQVAGARKLAEAIWRLRTMGEVFDFRKPFGPLPLSVLTQGSVG